MIELRGCPIDGSPGANLNVQRPLIWEPDDAHAKTLRARVQHFVNRSPIVDLHTHLFPADFGKLCLSGVDELLTYHYLLAEALRFSYTEPETLLAMSKTEQADFVWQTLFVDRRPVSEATTGVILTMAALGMDPCAKDLRQARLYSSVRIEERIEKVFSAMDIECVVMTNDPCNADESPIYDAGFHGVGRFRTALRIDPVLSEERGDLAWTKSYIEGWANHLKAAYVAASLPPDLDLSGESDAALRLRGAVLPALEQLDIPLALMIGVRRRINPKLDMAGDGLGVADLKGLESLLRDYPKVRFLVTTLARENTQELCVLARKFANLMPFGCWWFQNTPSLVHETTLMRLELLGTSFIPQHSDARILEQLIYKWTHARRSIASALGERYEKMAEMRLPITDAQITADVDALMRGNALGAIG